LEALISAGVSIVEAWELAGAASGSPQLKWQLARWREQMNSGTTPAELVSRTRYFPEMFANLYHSGEVSGRQDEMLGRLRSYYEEEGFRRLRLFSRLMNGTIYGLIVLIVAWNVISFHIGRINEAMQAF
jgi:type IV pilus assembly protein PilC